MTTSGHLRWLDPNNTLETRGDNVTQGIWSDDNTRFASKKALTDAVKAGHTTYLEATSVFGNEYDGPLRQAPDGAYYVVGPDPYKSRKWYAQIVKSGDTIKVK